MRGARARRRATRLRGRYTRVAALGREDWQMLEEFDVEPDVLARVIADLAAGRLIEIDVVRPGVDRR